MSLFSRHTDRATRKCSHSRVGSVPFVGEHRQPVAGSTWITTTEQWQCEDCSAIVAIDIFQGGLLRLGSDQLHLTSTIHLGLNNN